MNDNSIKQNNITPEHSKHLHSAIMQTVQIVKRRYYLYGVLSGFLVGLFTASWMLWDKVRENGSLDFLAIWFESIKTDIREIANFNEEIFEFIPLNDIGVWLLVFIITIVLLFIIFRFRKFLFLKVDKFKNDVNK